MKVLWRLLSQWGVKTTTMMMMRWWWRRRRKGCSSLDGSHRYTDGGKDYSMNMTMVISSVLETWKRIFPLPSASQRSTLWTSITDALLYYYCCCCCVAADCWIFSVTITPLTLPYSCCYLSRILIIMRLSFLDYLWNAMT